MDHVTKTKLMYVCNQSSALTATTGLLYIVSKRHELWSTNGFKLDHHFYPPSENFGVSLHCQASQTEISKRNSTTLCQTADGKSHEQSAVEKLKLYL